MSPKINVLSEQVMKRIAAGEVVERPASVAKELMENAVDAGATSVTLAVREAGLGLVQVTDNGEGMTEEDALLCSTRHATSKIMDVDDLESINTFGFRGEALASIGSVSRMTITTRTAESDGATQVRIDGGKVIEVNKAGSNVGTTVAVKDLFYNVPARRKFLKSATTELRHLVAMFRRMALSHHDLDWTMLVDGDQTLDVRRSSVESRVRELLGSRTIHQLIPVDLEAPGLHVSGFISRPGEGRKSRDNQFFFLNHRYIVNRSLLHALFSAYGPRLGGGESPVFVLFMEMDPKTYDINVHPMKIEVRFADERYAYDVVKRACQQAFKSPTVIPELHLVSHRKVGPSPQITTPSETGQLTLEAQRPGIPGYRESTPMQTKEDASLYQLHNRYIISQIKSGMTLIDQHVAHERILYERALRSRQGSMGLSQQMLFPQTVQLTHEDFLVLTEMLPFLERIGFGLKEFGTNTVVIEAVPIEVKTGQEQDVFLNMIDRFKELREESEDPMDAVSKAFACKSAIKSGDPLTQNEMASLIEQLFTTNEPYFCPHGRPIILNLSLKEIDEKFGR